MLFNEVSDTLLLYESYGEQLVYSASVETRIFCGYHREYPRESSLQRSGNMEVKNVGYILYHRLLAEVTVHVQLETLYWLKINAR